MAHVAPVRADEKKVLYADESGFATNLSRRWGWAPSGRRCVGRVPWGRWQTTTFVGALRTTGLTAPLVLDGSLTIDAFRAYVAQLLVPTLRAGDVVILDNLSVHKDPLSEQQIEQAGATLRFLPPTVLTSIQLSWSLPNSKPWPVESPTAPVRSSGPTSAPSYRTSPRENVTTTSTIVAIPHREML